MSQQNKKNALTTEVTKGDAPKGLSLTARLVLRLISDKRVNFLLKLLPLGTLVYLLSPDPLPFIIDDAVIIGLGTYVFIELCPSEIVEEHKAKLSGQIEAQPAAESGEVVDSEFKDQQ